MKRKATLDAVLERLQSQTFGYFLHETNPANGLVIDKTAADWPASIAGVGLALARTGMLWKLTRKCPYIACGLRRAGFDGSWLRAHQPSS